MSQARIASIVSLLAVVPTLATAARAAPNPREVFDSLRQHQAERRFVECAAQGEAAAAELPEWTAIWHIVAECYAADAKPCEAEIAVGRFLASTRGASEERVAQARQLAAQMHATCAERESGSACLAAYDAADWAGCATACMAIDNTLLQRPRAQMLVRCLLHQGKCDEAKLQLGGRDPSELEAEDRVLWDGCGLGSAPIEPPGPSIPEPSPPPATSVAPYVVGGLGVGAVIVGAIFLGVAQSDAGKFAALRDGPRYDAEYADLKSTYDTHAVVGYASVGGGLALVGAGLVMWLLDGDETPAAPTPGPTSLVPTLDPSGFSLHAQLRF